jgi:lauroyl/myristoyl acyltransferase
MFKYFIYKFGQFCVTRLTIKASYRIAMFLSGLQYYLSPRDRRAVRSNLRVIVPSADKKQLEMMTKDVFCNFGKYLVEFFRMANDIDENFIRQRIKMENIHYVHEVMAKKKGAIFLTAHIGNWELGGLVISMLGYPVIAIALSHKERPVNDLFNAQRQSRGLTVLPLKNAFRRCAETLKNNGGVAIVADRDFTNRGEVMDFLGKRTLIPKGAAILSSKTGAPIIPVFLTRQDDDTFLLRVEKPIEPVRECPDIVDKQTIITIIKSYIKVMEENIRRAPTQWLMFRPFWIIEEEEEFGES